MNKNEIRQFILKLNLRKRDEDTPIEEYRQLNSCISNLKQLLEFTK